MAIQAKNHVPCFEQQIMEQVSRIIANTDKGLTGTQIGHALESCKIPDVTPGLTKWKRLYNALIDFSNKHQCGNHVILFINHVMNPALYTNAQEKFHERQAELNQVLSLCQMKVTDGGKIAFAKKAKTLSEAIDRACRLRSKLERRGIHQEVLKHCLAEIKTENYFHAVVEAIKSITTRVRQLANSDEDGATLVNLAFSGPTPLLKINAFATKTEKGEQRGFASFLKGIYGMSRNPLSHEAKIEWDMDEQDAIDLISTISFIHRKLDCIQQGN